MILLYFSGITTASLQQQRSMGSKLAAEQLESQNILARLSLEVKPKVNGSLMLLIIPNCIRRVYTQLRQVWLVEL